MTGEDTDSINADTGQKPKAAKAKRSKRKWPLVLGIVAFAFIVAGTGLWIWHETPGFCGTVCHDTMYSYVEGFEESDYLVHDHAEAGLVCLDCHEPVIEDQLKELQVQLSGNYRTPLAQMETDDSFCLRDGCHTRESIETATSDYTAPSGEKVNPHSTTVADKFSDSDNPHEISGNTISCSNCHTSHRKSAGIGYCYEACHHAKNFTPCQDCHDHR